MMFKLLLQGKNIFITGASRGLGKSFALEFARQGANVYFNFLKDQKGADETVKLIREMGRKCAAYRASVLNASELVEIRKDLLKANINIDILVNNAGVSQALPFPLQNESDWDEVLDTNVKSLYEVTQVFLPGMIKRRKGVILNVGSLAGEKMIAAPVHYCTSKAAVKGFSASLSKEVARYGVRVLCLAPGLLKEGVARNLPENLVEEYEKHIALRRIGEFDEVSRWASFLVSDFNSYMSGQSLVVDGGF